MPIISLSSDDLINPNSKNTIIIINPPTTLITINQHGHLNYETSIQTIKDKFKNIFGKDVPQINNIKPPRKDFKYYPNSNGNRFVTFRMLAIHSPYNNTQLIVEKLNNGKVFKAKIFETRQIRGFCSPISIEISDAQFIEFLSSHGITDGKIKRWMDTNNNPSNNYFFCIPEDEIKYLAAIKKYNNLEFNVSIFANSKHYCPKCFQTFASHGPNGISIKPRVLLHVQKQIILQKIVTYINPKIKT